MLGQLVATRIETATVLLTKHSTIKQTRTTRNHAIILSFLVPHIGLLGLESDKLALRCRLPSATLQIPSCLIRIFPSTAPRSRQSLNGYVERKRSNSCVIDTHWVPCLRSPTSRHLYLEALSRSRPWTEGSPLLFPLRSSYPVRALRHILRSLRMGPQVSQFQALLP